MENVKRCSYRNCCKVIIGRPNKKFCDSNCRNYENIYNMRERNRYKKEKDSVYRILESYKDGISQELIDLYKKINSK